jgi:hypothetical protein
MSDLVFGKDVELRPHSIDRYGRLAARVLVDGRDAGLEPGGVDREYQQTNDQGGKGESRGSTTDPFEPRAILD